jgi:hypothetical protein
MNIEIKSGVIDLKNFLRLNSQRSKIQRLAEADFFHQDYKSIGRFGFS